MIVLIDNYDSFTYNLVRLLEDAGARTLQVLRNDQLSLAELRALPLEGLIISPGPGRPATAGISLTAVRGLANHCPILGVCLGHQCLVEAFGGRLRSARRLWHGKTSAVYHDQTGPFAGLPSPLRAARYHSLAADPDFLPPELRITARAEDGEIMGLEHRHAPLWGLQFHPESFLTEFGPRLALNLLGCIRSRAPDLSCRPPGVPPDRAGVDGGGGGASWAHRECASPEHAAPRW